MEGENSVWYNFHLSDEIASRLKSIDDFLTKEHATTFCPDDDLLWMRNILLEVLEGNRLLKMKLLTAPRRPTK
jgi:hypothetical protein